MNKRRQVLALGGALLGAAAFVFGALPSRQAESLELVKKVPVPGNAGWVDTGLDVVQGEELIIKGSGEITLQKGNPSANCGPAGLDLMTVQQPIPNQNLGALVGKVAQLIAVRKDEDTGEEVRDEIAAYFFVGGESRVTIPVKGRLYLGVNENVVRDNGGEFTALVYRRRG
jgi:hypothetical protein